MSEDSVWHSWLPEQALAPLLPSEALDAALELWMRRWLASGKLQRASWASAPSAPSGTFAAAEGAADVVASAIYGNAIDEPLVRSEERARLRKAAGTALAELERSCTAVVEKARLLGTPEGARRSAGLLLGDRRIASIVIFEPRLVAEAKRLAAGSRPGPLEPSAVRRGVAAQQVSFAAFVGAARLDLSELAGLAAGDIVLLDRAAGTPLVPVLDGRRIADQPCHVRATAEAIALALV